MTLKPGVKIGGIKPETVVGLIVAEKVYQQFGSALTVTAVLDGQHMTGSLHYSGCAADLRTRGIAPEKVQGIAAAMRSQLGAEFDVVVESDHIHLEFDPR